MIQVLREMSITKLLACTEHLAFTYSTRCRNSWRFLQYACTVLWIEQPGWRLRNSMSSPPENIGSTPAPVGRRGLCAVHHKKDSRVTVWWTGWKFTALVYHWTSEGLPAEEKFYR